MNLFGNDEEVIRTLGFWQPFGSLMLHGKIETRKVAVGKKPPFPLGKYLFYTTQKPTPNPILFNWCGPEIMSNIVETLKNEPTRVMLQTAIAIGELKAIRPMINKDEEKCFVQNIDMLGKSNWCLCFENVQRIESFIWNYGKQGVGFVPKSELVKIKIIPH